MILKVRDEWGAWVFHDGLERVRVSHSIIYTEWKDNKQPPSWYQRIETLEGDTEATMECLSRFNEILFDRRRATFRQGDDGSLTTDCIGVFGIKDENSLSILFNTEAYLLSDDGKTIERL